MICSRRGRRLRHVVVPLAAVAAALALTSGATDAAAAASAGRLPTLPDAPDALVVAARTAQALDSGPLVPAPQVVAQAQEDIVDEPLAICTGGLDVIASVSGTGAETTITLKTAPTSFAVASIPSTWWRNPPVTTPLWRMYFQGLMWIRDVANTAVATGDAEAIDALVQAAAASLTANPDPGTAAYGWDEGTNLRRQESLNCLYRASNGDSRIVPAIEATARANMDVTRYYGPPYHTPHNHGVMANLALLDAGQLLDRSTWRSTAVTRLVADSSGAFTAGGVSIEQSTGYHVFNTQIWHEVSLALAAYPDPAISSAAPGIEAQVVKAQNVTAHMTDPLGRLVPYGDGNDQPGNTSAQPSATVRDDAAGLVTGRWSWTDPMTSYYLIRYGPPRRAHGHQDRGSLVWTTLGVPVLIDPGVFSADPGTYTTYQKGTTAHSVQIVSGRTLNTSAWATVTARTSSGSAHAVLLTDSFYGVPHSRNWRIDNTNHKVTLTDTIATAGAISMLHFDRTWTAGTLSTDRKTVRLTHPSGRSATVIASAPMAVYRQATREVLGWQFPVYGQRYGAVQLLMYPPSGTSTMTITVS